MHAYKVTHAVQAQLEALREAGADDFALIAGLKNALGGFDAYKVKHTNCHGADLRPDPGAPPTRFG